MNSKQIKQAEKAFGYNKKVKQLSQKERDEIRVKKIAMGKQIEERNREETLNRLLQEDRERDDKIIKSFVDSGMSLEEANKILLENKKITEKRELKKKRKKINLL